MIDKLNIPRNASIVILTGAGISAESGLATFRASDGLWEGHNVADVATPEAFMRNATLVHDFYNQRRASLLDPKVQPNPAHKALARLEQQWPQENGGEILIITQNIDDLHERAGSKHLFHMHGELLKAFCTHCRDTDEHTNETVQKLNITTDMSTEDLCNTCGYTSALRPDIVWFGEMPYYMNQISEALQNCDLFISIGTSGKVYPAAGFATEAFNADAYTIEINLEPASNSSVFHEHIHGQAGTEVPKFVDALLA